MWLPDIGRQTVNLHKLLIRCVLQQRQQLQQHRKTWVLRRVYTPEPTQPGCFQRNPEEHSDLMKYEVVAFETKKPAGPLKVILLEDIEGVGNQFDVVDVDRELARTDLLLTHKVTYASPFNLDYYQRMKEEMKDELAKRVRIPYEYLVVGRELIKRVIPLRVSVKNPWILDKKIVKASMRQENIEMLDEMIFLSEKSLRGPNFELEARLVRFYVVICNRHVVPMIGKICHVSSDENKQVLSPETAQAPSTQHMQKCGLVAEEPYYAATDNFDDNSDIVGLMRQRATRPNKR